jgi:hypothetical protein
LEMFLILLSCRLQSISWFVFLKHSSEYLNIPALSLLV